MATKPTTQPNKIEPPEGWKLHSEHGFMRCGPEPGDKLVRIADIVLWLMETKELPCGRAVDAVCTALLGSDGRGAQLFIVDKSDDAKLVTPLTSFFYIPIVSFWDTQPSGGSDDLGLPGAVKAMRTMWGGEAAPGKSNFSGVHVIDPLAVRFELAHALWDWGNIKKVVPLQAVSSLTAQAIKGGNGKNKRGEWSQEARAIMKAASDAAKASGEKIEDVAKTFGMTRQAFSGVVNRPRKGTRSKTNATPAQKQATR
jgi:hypothetical protein